MDVGGESENNDFKFLRSQRFTCVCTNCALTPAHTTHNSTPLNDALLFLEEEVFFYMPNVHLSLCVQKLGKFVFKVVKFDLATLFLSCPLVHVLLTFGENYIKARLLW